MSADLATVAQRAGGGTRTVLALGSAGFRRYSTYRQATFASTFTNCIFGFLRCYVLLAAAAATGRAAGYRPDQLALYCWASQGIIGVVLLWGWTELGDRIRSGDVVADLLRPIHPVVSYLAVDLGRAGYAMLVRFAAPMVVGAVFFTLYVPHRIVTYPLFVVSLLLAVIVSFGVRYLVNAAGFWLLDVRGVVMISMLAFNLGVGLTFPLHFLPTWLTWTVWVATPFPSIVQAPMDVLVEYGSTGYSVAVVAGQLGWCGVLLGLCRWAQSRAERRMVVQGG